MDRLLTLGAGFLAAVVVVFLEGAGINILIRAGVLFCIIYFLLRNE